jgi:hypothetical protein
MIEIAITAYIVGFSAVLTAYVHQCFAWGIVPHTVEGKLWATGIGLLLATVLPAVIVAAALVIAFIIKLLITFLITVF